MSDQSQMARTLVNLGYSIFPLVPDLKIPAVPWKHVDPMGIDDVTDWWDSFPDDNIGINTGVSNLLVIDIDNKHALRTWDILWDKNTPSDCPEDGFEWDRGVYPIIKTPRGFHIYMDPGSREVHNTSGNMGRGLGEGIDTRGIGGMVVGPASCVRGKSYRLVAGHLDYVDKAPGWLTRRLVKQKTLGDIRAARKTYRKPTKYQADRELGKWCHRIAHAHDGEQNNTINIAAHLLRDYIPPLELGHVINELEMAAERGHHPMSRARPTIRSGLGV